MSSEEGDSSERIPLISVMSFDESSASLETYRSNALSAISSIQRLRGELYRLTVPSIIVVLLKLCRWLQITSINSICKVGLLGEE